MPCLTLNIVEFGLLGTGTLFVFLWKIEFMRFLEYFKWNW